MSSPLTPALWRAILVFLATAAVGAAQLAEFRDRHFDAATGQILSLVDLDADGDLDLVALPQEQRPLLLHENLGQLRFRDLGATALPPASFPPSLVLLDISGDGRPDILTPGSVLRAFVRVGGLYREESWRLPTGLGPVYRVHFGDVDGDGDVDLLALTAQLRVLRNDGTGNFTLDPLPGPDTPWAARAANARVARKTGT